MPSYRSHKVVQAARILKVIDPEDGTFYRTLETDEGLIGVSPEYVEKHTPQAGGYYVLYPDGYESWSTAEAFEGGYTRIEENAQAMRLGQCPKGREDHKTPTTGRTVLYRLSERDCEQINRRRNDSIRHFRDNTGDAPGWIAHVGNLVSAGEIVPMVIVAIWPAKGYPKDWGGDKPTDRVNGQAILDGNDSLWVTNAAEGHADGQWHWPVRKAE
jgi:hypothetical protein